MQITRSVASVVLLSLACSGVVSAKTTRIAELGSSPLIGSITSTPEMQADVAHRGVLLADAAQRLGITSSEYGRFRQAVAHGDARWVTVPRHLDAMSWRSGRRIHVLRDVMIPAGTHGWQVNLDEGNRLVALYMPARCGNLSMVVSPIRRVAHVPRPLVAAAAHQPAPVAAAPAEVAPPVEAAPAEVAVQPTPVPRIEAPIYHATHLSPFAIIPILFGFTHGGGGGGGTPSTTTATSTGPGCGVPACY